MDKNSGKLLNGIANEVFRAKPVFSEPNIHALIRHLARMAAEKDYKMLQKSGQIPYSSPKQRENNYE